MLGCGGKKAHWHLNRALLWIVLPTFASGCAAGFRHQVPLLLYPGTTTQQEVLSTFGPPVSVIKQDKQEGQEEQEQSYVYIEQRRNVLKGILIGAGSLGGIAIIPATALAPFTLGVSFVLIPIAAAAGGLGGAIIGAFVKTDNNKLMVRFDAKGIVKDYQVVPLSR